MPYKISTEIKQKYSPKKLLFSENSLKSLCNVLQTWMIASTAHRQINKQTNKTKKIQPKHSAEILGFISYYYL